MQATLSNKKVLPSRCSLTVPEGTCNAMEVSNLLGIGWVEGQSCLEISGFL